MLQYMERIYIIEKQREREFCELLATLLPVFNVFAAASSIAQSPVGFGPIGASL